MMADDNVIRAKLSRGQFISAQEAKQIGYTGPQINPLDLAAQFAAAKKATGPTQAELDAIAASKTAATSLQVAAKTQAQQLAEATGATIDTKTGKINPPTKIPTSTKKTIKSYQRYVDPASGAEYGIPVYEDGTTGMGDRNSWVLDYFKGPNQGFGNVPSNAGRGTYTASDGTVFTDQQAYVAYESFLKDKESQRLAKIGASQSAYDLLYQQFAQYGLGSLVEPLKDFIQRGISQDEFTLRLRDTDAYKKRFAANAQRVAKGLRALDEATYIGLEDKYQEVMRQYGLPESYYAKGEMGRQEGFEKLIANDVSNLELEDRIQTAQNRVINAAPEIKTALKQFYPGITNGDILAYALDPQQAITDIKRKVGAAEIGGAALQAGLQTGLARAEELQRYGVTQQAAQQGFKTIGGGLQRGSELASIYAQSPYTQTTAEQEVFGLPSATEASAKRKKLIGLEQATFGGRTGAGGAFERERAGGY
jgi:hypothetical protein